MFSGRDWEGVTRQLLMGNQNSPNMIQPRWRSQRIGTGRVSWPKTVEISRKKTVEFQQPNSLKLSHLNVPQLENLPGGINCWGLRGSGSLLGWVVRPSLLRALKWWVFSSTCFCGLKREHIVDGKNECTSWYGKYPQYYRVSAPCWVVFSPDFWTINSMFLSFFSGRIWWPQQEHKKRWQTCPSPQGGSVLMWVCFSGGFWGREVWANKIFQQKRIRKLKNSQVLSLKPT